MIKSFNTKIINVLYLVFLRVYYMMIFLIGYPSASYAFTCLFVGGTFIFSTILLLSHLIPIIGSYGEFLFMVSVMIIIFFAYLEKAIDLFFKNFTV